MKLEVEITEAEIRSAIERKIRVAVADESGTWAADNYIKKRVKTEWSAAVDRLVLELLADSDTLRLKVQASIEAKLKAQITALMKDKK